MNARIEPVQALFVALAGAAGAVARYSVGAIVGVRTFPWATLGINLTGCFLLGLLLGGPGPERWSMTINTTLAVGFLGAFTTFSTFSYEVFTLVRTDRPGAALLYASISLGGGILAAAGGYAAGRALL